MFVRCDYYKYGFAKRVGEEVCECYRRNHQIRYVALRTHDFTPWGSDYANRYGARLLYSGVDRGDVMDCVLNAVKALSSPPGDGAEPEGLIVNALRANAFTAEQIADWEQDPAETCECIFPGSQALVTRYTIQIECMPPIVDLGPGATQVFWHSLSFRDCRCGWAST